MNYKLLGKSGLRVSEICLGTMTFGEEWGYGADLEGSRRMFDTFLEAGGNFIDTANRYTEGTSERYLGEMIGPLREQLVIATKYTLFSRRGDANASGNHRKNLVQSLEASLRRLRVDYVDVLYVHAWDFTTPVAEVMRALDDLVRAGKVLHVGISDTPAWVAAQANTLADLRGWSPFVVFQAEYSLLQRTTERDILPMCNAFDMALTAWAPLAGGALTGKYLSQQEEPRRLKEGSARLNERSTAIAREVRAVADEIGCTSAQVALNWVRRQQKTVIPIVGARNAAQLKDSLDCLGVVLSDEHMVRLEAASRIDLGFPHEFLISQGVREVTYGGTYDQLQFDKSHYRYPS